MSDTALLLIIGTLIGLIGVFVWLLSKLAKTGGLFGTLAMGTEQPKAQKAKRLRFNFSPIEFEALDVTISNVQNRNPFADSEEIRFVVEEMLLHPERREPVGSNYWHHDYWYTFQRALAGRITH